MELLKATEADKFDIVTVSPINSTEMSENEDSLKLYFPSKQMILKWSIFRNYDLKVKKAIFNKILSSIL